MFNNPLDSFHNTVAEAKEEREQLDRLLTISTPRERLLVTVIAALLVILAVWLFFGNVTRSVTVNGIVLEPAATSLAADRSVQAVVWAASDVAPRIETGMRALIELHRADGEADALDGKIVAISSVPLPERLATLDSTAPVSIRRVGISLDKTVDIAPFAGRECRIVIETGRQSPIALVLTRQP